MAHFCEVCANFRPDADQDRQREIVSVITDQRIVLLCKGHAKIAANSGVTTFEELRELYGKGQRSYVPRRRPAALQPTGKPRKPGRRATDCRL